MQHKFPKIFSFIALLMILFVFNINNNSFELISKTKKKTKNSKIAKSKKKKSKSNLSAKTKKNSSSTFGKKGTLTFGVDTINSIQNYEGVNYFNLHFTRGRVKHSAHVIEIDAEKFKDIEVIKAGNSVRDLRRLHDLLGIADSTDLIPDFLGGINASFWRAYSNNPIGPTFVNGEPIELKTYKNWSSTFFDRHNLPYIGNFSINATIRCEDLCEFTINNINKRNDSLGVILYNKYYGHEIPYVAEQKIEKLLEETLMSFNEALEVQDSTEDAFDIEQFKQSQREIEQDKNIEKNLIKIVCEYLEKPEINKTIRARVVSKNKGVVEIPENGFIVTFGIDYPEDLIPQIGKMIELKYETNIYPEVRFMHSVSATPRLVSEGIAKHQAYEEGSKGRRFILRDLPRTAIGYNEDKSKLYLVCLEATNDLGIKGVSLERLANIMKMIGCYDAMNLDGGGSSNMIFEGKNRARRSSMFNSRKISVAIGVKV